MARYDYEGQLEFAEQKISEARKSRERTAKKQEKFAKRLLMFDTVVRGGNFLINQRADDLMMAQAPQKARYNQFLQDHQKLQTTFQPYIEKGGNPLDYLTDYYYDMYEEEVTKARPNALKSSYDAWLRNESRKKAEAMLPTFNKMQQESADVPSYEEFINQYEKYADRVAPRTLAGAAGKFVKNLFGKETEETIAYKNEKAKDVLYDTPVLKEVTELKKAVQDWNAKGNGVVDIVRAINEKAAKGELVFKDLRNPEIVEWDVPVGNNIIRKKGVLYITTDAKGNKIETVKDLDLYTIKEGKSEKPLTFAKADKEAAFNAAKSLISSYGKKSDVKELFDTIIADENLGLTFGQQVLQATASISNNPTTDTTAQQLATEFLLKQVSEQGNIRGLNTTITQWDIIKLSPPTGDETKYLKEKILPNIDTYYKEIETKLGANSPVALNLYNDTLKFIQADSMDLTKDERIQYTQDLNKVFGKDINTNIDVSQQDETEEQPVSIMPPKKEPMSIVEVSSKYKVDENFINKLINIKPKIGGVTQQAPFREDPIDLVTDKMLYDAGYISKGKDAPAFKMIGRRNFIRDLYKDLQL